MADTRGEFKNDIWPMPKFYFNLTWGRARIRFSEASGLQGGTEVIEYRHGDRPDTSSIRMPGIRQAGTITMKRGVFVGDTAYWDWINDIQLRTISGGRSTVTIELLNEQDKPAMSWELSNAWPTKITSTDLKSRDTEVAIETLEIAFERLTVQSPGAP